MTWAYDACVTPGAILRRRRIESGYTLESLAAAIGVTLSSVAQWEAGRTTPKRSSAQRVDKALKADGALMAAFGYVTPPSPVADQIAELRSQVADLTEVVARLQEHVALLGGEVVPTSRRAIRPGAQSSGGFR